MVSRDRAGTVVVVDRSLCIGAAQCVLAAPESFDQSEQDGLVLPLTALSGERLSDAVVLAAHLCPSGALSLAEKELTDQDRSY